VHVYHRPEETPAGLVQTALAAMTSPTGIYHAKMVSEADGKLLIFLGDFVYVDGGFRYLDLVVMQALSTAPTPLLKIGGNVQAAKLMYRVNPVYPEAARSSGRQGIVKLHAIIGKDGSVRNIEVISGDSLLVQAALDAVKQW
jgi:outer membrane biosynthesis protein TonB